MRSPFQKEEFFIFAGDLFETGFARLIRDQFILSGMNQHHRTLNLIEQVRRSPRLPTECKDGDEFGRFEKVRKEFLLEQFLSLKIAII